MPRDKKDTLPPKFRQFLNHAHQQTIRTLHISRHALTSLGKRTSHTAQLLRLQSNSLLNHPALSARLNNDYLRGGVEFLTAAVTLSILAYATYIGLARFRTAEHIPQRLIRRGRVLHGVVVSVRDGDGLRVRHVPFLRRLFNDYSMPRVKRVAEHTINVRLAAVDAPESAQRFGRVAKNWLKDFALHKRVSLRLHSMDRYQRVIATVHTKHQNPILRALGWGSKNVSLELTRAGYATLYEGSGAQYGSERMKRLYMAVEDVAKRRRLGMWVDKKNYVSPMDFKRVMKNGELAKLIAKSGSDAEKSMLIQKAVGAPTDKKLSESLLTALYKFAIFSYQFLKRYR